MAKLENHLRRQKTAKSSDDLRHKVERVSLFSNDELASHLGD